MAFTVRAIQGIAEDPIALTELIRRANGGLQQVKFPQLRSSGPGAVSGLTQGMADPVRVSREIEVVRAVNLVSCAAVCFVNADPQSQSDVLGYVLHSNAGAVAHQEFMDAMDALGAQAPYTHVSVVFAHPNPSDAGYRGSLASLAGWGVPNNSVVEVSELPLPNFGLHRDGWVGY